jgi:TatD DNase family protein
MLIDTHAHVHFDELRDVLESIFRTARSNHVESIISVGTNEEDSIKALTFVNNPTILSLSRDINLYATVGIHPHDASRGKIAFERLNNTIDTHKQKKKIVAIGECGLDYYKNHSSKTDQFKMLEWQLELADKLNLPVVFHVRDAWEDFFAILKDYPNIRGVIHSFTGYIDHVEQANKFNLYFGINGIMTFTKDPKQVDAISQIPINRLLLETDCPYLAPAPYRGKINQPGYVKLIAEFVASTLASNFTSIAKSTTQNAKELFSI